MGLNSNLILVGCFYKLCDSIALAYFAGKDAIVDQGVGSWVGVYVSTLVACRLLSVPRTLPP